MLLCTLIYGFINSCILALLALGFNLTFGISGVANFAYGAIYIFSGFLTWITLNSIGLPYLLSVFISILCAALARATANSSLSPAVQWATCLKGPMMRHFSA